MTNAVTISHRHFCSESGSMTWPFFPPSPPGKTPDGYQIIHAPQPIYGASALAR